MKDIHKLEINQIPVHFVPLPDNRDVVYIDFFIKAGRIFEDTKESGLGHLLEHYIHNTVNKQFQNKSGCNAYIDSQWICFTFEDRYGEVFENYPNYLSNILKPNFDNNLILEREKKVIKTEFLLNRSNPKNKLVRKIFNLRFEKSPLKNLDRDSTVQLDNYTLEDLKTYFYQIINYEKIVIVGAYDLSQKNIESATTILRKLLPDSQIIKNQTIVHSYSKQKIKINSKQKNQLSNLAVTFPGMTTSDSELDIITLQQVLQLMTCSEDIGLNSEIRKLGGYSIEYHNYIFGKTGFISLQTSLPKESVKKAIQKIVDKINFFKNNSITKAILDEVIQKDLNVSLDSFRSNSRFFSLACDKILNGFEPIDYYDYERLLKQINPKSIQEVSRRVFNYSAINIIIDNLEKNYQKEILDIIPTD